MKNLAEVSGELKKGISAGLNILLTGSFGTGKSSVLLALAKQLDLRMKYFSASTLDPFADLVGVPLPVEEDQGRHLVYVRPDDIQRAQILFFDELNRAHPKVQNAVFEIIQFRTINGEVLPHLRCVVAAINPASAGFHVQELDPALLDRFHLHLQVDFGPDPSWYVLQFGKKIGQALIQWHQTDLDDAQRKLISNRRLEFIGRAIAADIDPRYALPGDSNAPVHLLKARLCEDSSVLTIEQLISRPEEFASLLPADLNLAMRFAQLLPMMNPNQKNRVRELVLVLPSEVLAQIKSATPFVFKKLCEAVTRHSNATDARAFAELLDERLSTIAQS